MQACTDCGWRCEHEPDEECECFHACEGRPGERDDILPLYGAAGSAYRRFALEGAGGVQTGEVAMLTVADRTRILIAFKPQLGRMLWLTPPAARRWAEQVLETCRAAEAGEGPTPEIEEQIKAFLDAIPAQAITPGQVIQILEEFQKSFRDKGVCKMLTWGEQCSCPLCHIDAVIALLKHVGESDASSPPESVHE